MRIQLLTRLHRARLAAVVCAGSLLVAGAPALAQVGGAAGSNAAAPTAPAATQTGDAIGTFIADVSGHVKPEFESLTTDLREAIDNSQGNVREKLIAINDNVAKISSSLVDRAKETNEQARDRLGEVRKELNEIHNELTTLAGTAPADSRERIIAVRNSVDTLRDNLQTATESRFRGTLDAIKSRVTKVEQRARDTAENVRAETREAVGDLKERAADVADTVREEVKTLGDGLPNTDVSNTGINSERQGKLGVTVRQGSTVLVVTSVFPDSAAAEIGMQTGDQILSINRRRIVTHGQLVHELKAAAAGDGRALVMIRRNGRTQELEANLRRAANDAASGKPLR